MGFIMGLLKFAHFIAWPVVALGYPLFASIRAIETGSENHMKKLLIYWILVSLLSLFEFTFVKIIEWIPFWSSIKLIAVLWLAIPRFHGACCAYQSYIRPCLVVYLQEVIRRFEEQCSTTGIFLDDVADRYEKENEFGNSEKLIVIESDEKNDASALEQRNGPAAAALELKDNEMLEALEKSAGCAAATQTKQAQTVTKETTYAAVVTKGIITTTPTQKTKETTYAAVVTEGIITTTRTQTLVPENTVNPSTPPANKDRQEWTCPLCQVTTSCENNLNDHLRGKKHKSMCQSLKSSKLNGQYTRPGSPMGRKDGSKQKSCRKPEERVGNQDGGATRHFCFLCNLKLVGDASLASHLKGKKHSSNIEIKWGKIEGVVT